MVPLAWSLFCAPPALAADGEPAASGAEIALVLELRSGETRAREARALKVGALLMAGALGAEDHLTVLGPAEGERAPPQIALDEAAISGLVGPSALELGPALRAGAMALWTSPRAERLLVLASSGGASASEPALRPSEARALLVAPDRGQPPIYGLSVSAGLGRGGSAWLSGVVAQGDDLVEAPAPLAEDQGAALALSVAGAMAGTLDAAPRRSVLGEGAHPLLEGASPGSEIVVMLARAGGAPGAVLIGPDGAVAPRAAGVMPCAEPVGPDCEALGYASFRVPVGPGAAGGWTLDVPPGERDAVLVLARPALRLALAVPESLDAGEQAPIAATLLDGSGAMVTDPVALLGEGLYARAWDDRALVTLTPQPGGRLTGRWTPLGPTGRAVLHARVQSATVDLSAEAVAFVEGELSPILIPDPAALDLGTWKGEWVDTRRCAEIDLSRSLRASGLPILCRAGGRLDDARLTCQPAPGQAELEAPRRFVACVVAEGCCRDLPTEGDAPAELRFLARENPEAPPLLVVPVRYAVQSAGFWRCNFPALIATSALGLLIMGGLGLRTRRRRFSPLVGLRFANSEPGLRRAEAWLLSAHARRAGLLGPDRVGVDDLGAVSADLGAALLTLEAGPAGAPVVSSGPGLERRLATGAWEPVGEGERLAGLQPGTIYRVDARLYFTLLSD